MDHQGHFWSSPSIFTPFFSVFYMLIMHLISIFQSRSRLNLSLETVFSAANYLDRFISMNQWHVRNNEFWNSFFLCSFSNYFWTENFLLKYTWQGWKYWMVELLSVACLSVASKFTESFTPSFDEIQVRWQVIIILNFTVISITDLKLYISLYGYCYGWRWRTWNTHLNQAQSSGWNWHYSKH